MFDQPRSTLRRSSSFRFFPIILMLAGPSIGAVIKSLKP